MTSRRTFLKRAGATAVLVVGGGSGLGVWRARQQGVFAAGEGPAYEPWINWQRDTEDGPLALVRAGILAANPHNTQPWLFRVTDTAVELYADIGRNLGAFDPYLREMHLGLGCALENMVLAAAAHGYEASLELVAGTLDQADESPAERSLVARVNLVPAAARPSDLYEAIAHRHTNRGPYDQGRPLAPETLTALHELNDNEPELRIFLFDEPPTKASFGDLVIQSTEAIIADGPMVHDSERWFRHSWQDVQTFRDGPTLDAAGLSPLMTTAAKMLPRPSAETNHQYWLDATRDVQVPTAPLLGLIAVRALYDKPQSLKAGRLWQRMHLWATAHGIAMQPLNQPVERVDRERQLGHEPHTAGELERFIGGAEWKPTFAFRAGYAQRDASPSPRRPADDVML